MATTLDPRMQRRRSGGRRDPRPRRRQGPGRARALWWRCRPTARSAPWSAGATTHGSQFNRATQALRQPGSAFKAIVYPAALGTALAPARFNDHRIRIGNWEPHNFENEYRGEVSVGDAVAYSINTVAAQVIERTGVGNVIDMARRLGITSDLQHDASLALGTNEVTLLELTAAYASFASDGIGAWPYGIVEIKDSNGKTVYQRGGSGPGRVLSPEVAGAMNQLLAGVIERGTGRAARLDRPAAGKTGTTQDFRDALSSVIPPTWSPACGSATTTMRR